ncbi:hypothetical protein HH214_20625 [Mucilaginibacter robiniae]|uniref:Uncharacterized protein n=1 Tax=Mucilaginibacter robiniae TaxID=2728022 RepID=A0A7L5E655_9SPHI|nr:hypothetical protein [Mucilaginibacter robiniae]QJD98108.1 hypothetical protein HH214_20625 [Mucilaginibacter robiniae]
MQYFIIYFIVGFLIMYFNAFKHSAFWQVMSDEMDNRLHHKSDKQKQFKNHFLASVYILMMCIWPYVIVQLFLVKHEE